MNLTQVLLVEGVDDQHVIWALLQRVGFPQTFDIEQKGGIGNLLKVLPVQIKGSRISTVGIVADADTSCFDRWQSLRAIAINAGYQDFPILPESQGTIVVQSRLPRLGIWIMPDNSLDGMLEDFVADLVPVDDPCFSHVETVVCNLPVEARGFKDIHLTKARIHTWLAWQKDPGTPMGQALTKRYLAASSATADSFLAWLRCLFVPT